MIKPGQTYTIKICGLPRRYRILTKEEAAKNQGEDWVAQFKGPGFLEFSFVYDEYKEMTKVFHNKILEKEGELVK